MNTECCGKNVTINMGGCCGAGNGIRETVLYSEVINSVGEYRLTEDVKNYDDIFVIHESYNGNARSCLYMPVKCIGPNQQVCYGKGVEQDNAIFTIEGDCLKVLGVNNAYRIVSVIGRKYNIL